MASAGESSKQTNRDERFITAQFLEGNRKKWPPEAEDIFRNYMLEHDLYSTSLASGSAAKLGEFYKYMERYIHPHGWDEEKHKPLFMTKVMRRMERTRERLSASGRIKYENGAFVKVEGGGEDIPEVQVVLDWIESSDAKTQRHVIQRMSHVLGKDMVMYHLAAQVLRNQEMEKKEKMADTLNSKSPAPGGESPTLDSRSPTPGDEWPMPEDQWPMPDNQWPMPDDEPPTPGSKSPTPGSRSSTPGTRPPTPVP